MEEFEHFEHRAELLEAQIDDQTTDIDEEHEIKVRLDKWLWAARFFTTRALARAAVENGKILYNGSIVNPGKEITIGAVVLIKFKHNKKEKNKIIRITGLATRRRNNEESNALYETLSIDSLKELLQAQIRQNTASRCRSGYNNNHYEHADAMPKKRTARYLRRTLHAKTPQQAQYADTINYLED